MTTRDITSTPAVDNLTAADVLIVQGARVKRIPKADFDALYQAVSDELDALAALTIGVAPSPTAYPVMRNAATGEYLTSEDVVFNERQLLTTRGCYTYAGEFAGARSSVSTGELNLAPSDGGLDLHFDMAEIVEGSRIRIDYYDAEWTLTSATYTATLGTPGPGEFQFDPLDPTVATASLESVIAADNTAGKPGELFDPAADGETLFLPAASGQGLNVNRAQIVTDISGLGWYIYNSTEGTGPTDAAFGEGEVPVQIGGGRSGKIALASTPAYSTTAADLAAALVAAGLMQEDLS